MNTMLKVLFVMLLASSATFTALEAKKSAKAPEDAEKPVAEQKMEPGSGNEKADDDSDADDDDAENEE